MKLYRKFGSVNVLSLETWNLVKKGKHSVIQTLNLLEHCKNK